MRKSKYFWTKEQLNEAILHSSTVKDALLYLKAEKVNAASRESFTTLVKEYNLDTSHFKWKSLQVFDDGTVICPICKQRKSKSEFYACSHKSKGIHCRCKQCESELYSKPIKKKLEWARYLGGKCSNCGIEITENNYCIFDFHHIDPSEKEYGIAHLFNNCSEEKLKAEVDKCILLCTNCHRLEHNKNKILQ